jgi:hypothetical protein
VKEKTTPRFAVANRGVVELARMHAPLKLMRQEDAPILCDTTPRTVSLHLDAHPAVHALNQISPPKKFQESRLLPPLRVINYLFVQRVLKLLYGVHVINSLLFVF